MYTAGAVVLYRRSEGTLVAAAVLGHGAQSDTVQPKASTEVRCIVPKQFLFPAPGYGLRRAT